MIDIFIYRLFLRKFFLKIFGHRGSYGRKFLRKIYQKQTLNEFVPFADVFEPQLDGGGPAVEILHNGVADVNGVAGLDVVVEFGHIEADGRQLPVGLAFLHHVQLEVQAAGAHFSAVAGIIDILRQENGVVVARAEGLELLQKADELGRNLGEVQAGVNLHHGGEFLAGDVARHEAVHPAAEFFQVLFLHGKAGGIHMAAEVLQQVCAAFDGGIQVEALHAAGAAGDEAVALGEHHRGLVEGFHQAGGHNAHHALVPGGIVHDGHVLMGQGFAALHHLQGLLGNLPVYGLALVVVVVDLFPYPDGRAVIRGGEQFHRQPAAFHAARRVDARSNLEHDVVYADMSRLQLGQVNHGQQALARVLVQPLEAEVGQDAVLSRHGHQVRGDGNHLQVQQGFQQGEVQAVLLHIALGQLEAHAAAAEVVEGVVAVFPLGVQDGHRSGQFVLRQMVVADDDVDSLAAGIFHFLDGLDAAVQGNHQAYPVVRGPVQRLVGQAVALVVAVRDIEIHLGRKLLQEGVHLRYGGGAVHVVISVNQDFFFSRNGLVHPFHGLVHVLHQEGVVKVFQAGTEKAAGLFEGFDAALDQQIGQDPVYAQFRRQLRSLLRISSRNESPLSFRYAHNHTNLHNSKGNSKFGPSLSFYYFCAGLT